MFSIVIPLFNEDKNIKNLIDEISMSLSEHEFYEIILINDCSSDQTLDIVKNIKNKKIIIINNPSNLGQSYSIYKGIKESSYKIIVTLDGDGQNDPMDIPKLMDFYLSQKQVELVSGIRARRQDNLIKIVSSKIANFIRSKILNDNCKDTGCSLKVFNRDIFLSFPYFDGMHRFLPALFIGYGHKVEFINVNHRKRKFGVSKYGTTNRLFKGVRDMIKVKKIIKAKQK